MDTRHKFLAKITLAPGRSTPAHQVKVLLDQVTWHHITVTDRQTLQIDTMLHPGAHDLVISFQGKDPLDVEQSVTICDIELNGISDPRFVWRGIYKPDYPEPWASQQRESGTELAAEIQNTDYLGWNGTWCLRFGSPVFTWIHEVQDLGWIYQ